MTPQEIEAMIRAGMPEATVEVNGDDGVHFDARVISTEFAGKPTLKRHRMVYACLGEKMGHEIHALALKTQTPEEAIG